MFERCGKESLAAGGTIKSVYKNPKGFCKDFLAVDEVSSFAFDKHCFNSATALSPNTLLLTGVLVLLLALRR